MTRFPGWAQTAPTKPSGAAKPATTSAAAKPVAIIDTTVGKMTCTLFPDKAPVGVANFIGLASGTKDWRNPVSGDFMIQGGDPAGTGSGADPVPKFKNEVSSDLLFDRPGRLAYANAGPNTNSSQFFITEVATPHLNGGYTLFGQCDDASVALVKQIARMASDPSTNKPFRPVKINHISVVKSGAAAKPSTGTTVKKSAPKAAPKTSSTPN
ncbi:MAG: peptidylprolyl isomerase [Acidobacteria bacterium]|nr:MAG: peptidylprolyl isomerase [Acidobacteriota bacterium]